MHADERETDVAITETSQVAAASRTDKDKLYHDSMLEMIHQFLSHTIDVKSGNWIDKLVTKGVLSPDERNKIKEQRKIVAKVNDLLMMLRKKSAAEFESFLTALSETNQQSIADVVRMAAQVVGQTGRNPLQYTYGKTVWSV